MHPRPRPAARPSWDPRIFVYRGLLSEEECDHLVAASQVRGWGWCWCDGRDWVL